MAKSQKADVRQNSIRQFIDGSPLLTLCGAALAVGGTVYGALNLLYASKFEVTTEKLKTEHQRQLSEIEKRYDERLKQLDAERNRIQFTVKDQSSFLDLASIVMDEERLSSDYKRFRSSGFAVPLSALANATWKWNETTEFDLLADVVGKSDLSQVFADDQSLKLYQEIAKRTKLQAFESPSAVDVEVGGQVISLRARSVFQGLSKEDMDHAATVSNHIKVKSLFGSLEKAVSSLRESNKGFAVELARDLLPIDKPLPSPSLATSINPELMGQFFANAELPNIEELLNAVSTKISPERSEQVRKAYQAQLAENIAEARQKMIDKSDSKMTPVTRDLDYHYSALFSASYEGLASIGDEVSFSEIGLNRDYFVVKGNANVRGKDGKAIRIYYLRICVRREGRFFVAGYLIPAGDDLQDVRTAMSMVSGFKILR